MSCRSVADFHLASRYVAGDGLEGDGEDLQVRVVFVVVFAAVAVGAVAVV